jgi:hypothetical protein
VFESITKCNVDDCFRVGSRSDGQGNLYCLNHWQEKIENDATCSEGRDSCQGCHSCAVKDCNGEGVVMQEGTRRFYCMKHAWKSDRPDESGLSHPTQAKWDEVDIIRARGMGVKFDEGEGT